MLDKWKIVLIFTVVPRSPRLPRPSIWGWSRVPRLFWQVIEDTPSPHGFLHQIDDYKFNAFGKSVPAIAMGILFLGPERMLKDIRPLYV